MRIISQNGLLDMPYELIAISPYSGNMATIVGTFPGNALGKGDRVYILAEYSTEEKAKKAMEVLRKAYVGNIVMFQNVEPTDELKEMLKIHGIETIYAILDNQPQEIKFENHQNFYFQFPAEEELE